MSRTLADLVGQSLMLSFGGPTAAPELLEALAITRAGGVILFSDNIVSPAQLHTLVAQLQAHAAALGLPPLLVAIDQEGGTVTRLPAPFVTMPSQMAQAATGDPLAAYACAWLCGQQLRAFGINTNFAPVLDVNNNPANPVIGPRSFSSDAEQVTAFGLAALRGYRDAGVIATAKHFPGHGDTTIDSHLDLPVVRHSRERLDAVELAPFVAACRPGQPAAPAIMTAHIIFEALDDQPATISRRVLVDLLRGEIGYDGVIFTDALVMRALADSYNPLERALRCKAAGADVLLPLGSLGAQVPLAAGLCAAVEAGDLPLEAFAATAARLDRLRAAYGLTHTLPPLAAPDPAVATAAQTVAQRGLTLLERRPTLPLAPATALLVLDCAQPGLSPVEEASDQRSLLAALIAAAFPQARYLSCAANPDAAAIDAALAQASDRSAVLLVTRNALWFEGQRRLAAALAALPIPLIHAAVRSPYDAELIDAAATLLTYGDPPVSLQALVAALGGTAKNAKEEVFSSLGVLGG